mmetsp:Transcript_20008/g.37369  ORF Transcript_20008/g.37369 Transcript_20008/m.37369 type:complete len:80 (+) Transcript_20008:410-649(+)
MRTEQTIIPSVTGLSVVNGASTPRRHRNSSHVSSGRFSGDRSERTSDRAQSRNISQLYIGNDNEMARKERPRPGSPSND